MALASSARALPAISGYSSRNVSSAEGSMPTSGLSSDDNDPLSMHDVFYSNLACRPQQSLGEECPAALHVARNDYLITKLLKQHHGLDADITLIVVGEFIGEEAYCSLAAVHLRPLAGRAFSPMP